MSDTAVPKIGTIGWIDLTAGDADGLRDDSDYCMNRPDSGEAVAALIEPRS